MRERQLLRNLKSDGAATWPVGEALPRTAIIVPGGPRLRTWNPELSGFEGALPVDGQTLLEHQCRWLASHGIQDVLLVCPDLPDGSGSLPASGQIGDARLQLLSGGQELGTAGCLRDAEEFTCSEPFLVIHRNLLPHDLDLGPLLAVRPDGGTLIWALVEPFSDRSASEVSLDGDTVRLFPERHFSHDRRHAAASLEVFLCAPQVIEHVPRSSYFDLKEQLVPAVQAAGFNVRAVFSRGGATLIRDAADYLSAMSQSLYRRHLESGESEIDSGVWTRGEVEISRSATLIGPLLIEAGARIDEGAQVVGPAYIGPRVSIGKGARVRQSALWAGSRVSEGATLAFSVLAEGQELGPGETVSSVVRCESDASLTRRLSLCRPDLPTPTATRRPTGRSAFYPPLKRMIDVIGSSIGLVVGVPLFVLIALAIRLDSPGPVLYTQRRCGRFGAAFSVLKFRTMRDSTDAHKADSEREGPIYKRRGDPRITRLGAWLRSTSVDELPQLWNILKGEMSLVGPRPLQAHEMRYNPEWRALRLSVKPGLTGLWQLHARKRRDFRSWIQYDTEYALAPGSLRRDLEIIVKTVWGLITGGLRGE